MNEFVKWFFIIDGTVLLCLILSAVSVSLVQRIKYKKVKENEKSD